MTGQTEAKSRSTRVQFHLAGIPTDHKNMPAKPKPNQPCHCGSSQKYKKCCFLKEAEESTRTAAASTTPPAPKRRVSYRFKRGDAILAYHNKQYQPGRIVALNYWEPGWKEPVPYQIMLSDGECSGRLIYAPADSEQYVKALPDGFGRIGSNICVTADRSAGKRRSRAGRCQ